MTRPVLDAPFDARPHRLETPDGPVTWFEAGSGSTVLLLHSVNAAASSMEMAPLFEGLADRHRVVAFDWLGFGLSDRPDIRYRPIVMHRVLDAVLARVGGGRPDIVALSLPAQYAAVVATRSPERLRRLVAISPTGAGRFGSTGERATARRAAERFLRLPLVGSSLFRALGSRRSIDGFLDGVVADPASLPERYRHYAWATTKQPGADRAPLAFICGLLDDPRAEAAWRSLSVPTLMLVGDQPRFCDPAALAEVADANHAIRFVTIPDAGDLPHWEQTAVTLDRIRDFLAAEG